MAAQGIVESAIHLIKIKVVRRRACSLPALVVAARVDRFYQLVDFVRSKETGFAFPVRSTSMTPMPHGIEYGDGVVWPNCQPMGKGSGIAPKKRMQHERRQREIIDPIDVACNFHLLQMVAVNFDQDFHPELWAFCVRDSIKRKVSGIMKQLVPAFLMA